MIVTPCRNCGFLITRLPWDESVWCHVVDGRLSRTYCITGGRQAEPVVRREQ